MGLESSFKFIISTILCSFMYVELSSLISYFTIFGKLFCHLNLRNYVYCHHYQIYCLLPKVSIFVTFLSMGLEYSFIIFASVIKSCCVTGFICFIIVSRWSAPLLSADGQALFGGPAMEFPEEVVPIARKPVVSNSPTSNH